jgi:uncharacterized membrane protein (DUF2068 family)
MHRLFLKHFGLRGIAVFEAGKGLLAMGFAVWILTVLHKDMNSVAQDMLLLMRRFLHINPDRHFYRILFDAVGSLTHRTLWVIFAVTMLYVLIRFVEAAGLWLEKEWAEWFALISGGIYLPLEVAALIRHSTAWKWGILGVNLLIIVYLASLLIDSRKRKREAREAATA